MVGFGLSLSGMPIPNEAGCGPELPLSLSHQTAAGLVGRGGDVGVGSLVSARGGWGVFIYLYMGLYIVLWGMGEPAGGENPPLSPTPGESKCKTTNFCALYILYKYIYFLFTKPVYKW